MKLIKDNRDPLSDLAGFDPTSPETWSARPTSTLRFAEVLTKIYVSDFTAGEILFLFTADTHLDGDDPFPMQDRNESHDSPLDLPEAEHPHGLWSLRRKLLEPEVFEADEYAWTWHRIVHAMKQRFRLHPPARWQSFAIAR